MSIHSRNGVSVTARERGCLFCLLWLVASAASFVAGMDRALAAELTVAVQEVTDSRTTGEMFKGLKVNLKFSGPALSEAWGVLPPSMAKAESDLGENLLNEEDKFENCAFLRLRPMDANKEGVTEIELKNPGRQARRVTLSGTLAAYIPRGRKEETVVIENYQKQAGAAVSHPELKRRDVQFTYTVNEGEQPNAAASPSGAAAGASVMPPGATAAGGLGGLFEGMFGMGGRRPGLSMEIVDAKDQILSVQLFDSANRPVAFNGWSCSSGAKVIFPVTTQGTATNQDDSKNSKQCTLDSLEPLPKEGRLVLCLSTEENLRQLPFTIDVDLP